MNKKPFRKSSIQTSALPDGHAVLVNPDNSLAFTLTPLAALAWEFCDGTNSVDDIAALIQAIPEFQAGDSLKSEIATLLEELCQEGFLRTEQD